MSQFIIHIGKISNQYRLYMKIEYFPRLSQYCRTHIDKYRSANKIN